MESPSEKYSRVQQMIVDDGGTWDLSLNDKAALRYVLGLVNSLADEIADRSGYPIPQVIAQHAKIVESCQESR